MIDRIGVIVPAKNEAATIGACLRALSEAAAAVAVPVHVAVVLDDCSDDSAATMAVLADDHAAVGEFAALDVFTVAASNVGVARATAAAALLARPGPARTLWLASTDADSAVPTGWLSRQLDRAQAGAEVVLGTVQVAEWWERSTITAQRAEADYWTNVVGADGHGHVHGANLGVRGDIYLAAGGFPPLTLHEDAELVRVLRSAGRTIEWAVDIAVTTSARRQARVDGGFAGYLDDLEAAASPAPSPAPSTATTTVTTGAA